MQQGKLNTHMLRRMALRSLWQPVICLTVGIVGLGLALAWVGGGLSGYTAATSIGEVVCITIFLLPGLWLLWHFLSFFLQTMRRWGELLRASFGQSVLQSAEGTVTTIDLTADKWRGANRVHYIELDAQRYAIKNYTEREAFTIGKKYRIFVSSRLGRYQNANAPQICGAEMLSNGE